eukprot:jgi/Orpsp1_1/1183976/evm.model.c7180000087459.1
MECCIYIKQINNELRQIIITQKNNNNNKYALILYQQNSKNKNKYVAKYLPLSTINIEKCKKYSENIFGCLGLICIKEELFLILVTQIENIGKFNNKTIYRIMKVAFISLNNDLYDYCLNNEDSFQHEKKTEHPCIKLIRYLSRGTFYYADNYDLTRSTQNKFNETGKSMSYLKNTSNNFFWNKYLLKELLNFRKHLLNTAKKELDESNILLSVIQGFVSIKSIKIDNKDLQICLISRLSCKNYNAKGIDNDGNIADFIESEIIFSTHEYIFSFLQIRGNVPIFWDHSQINQTESKIELSQDAKSTSPAFNRHFEKMIKKYGHIFIINLLYKNENNNENILGKEFNNYFQKSSNSLKNFLKKLDYDVHDQYSDNEYNNILNIISSDLDKNLYFSTENNKIMNKQRGVIRINCLNCLDQANILQAHIAWYIFNKFISNKNDISNNYNSLISNDSNFKTVFKNLWKNNGEHLNKIYLSINDSDNNINESIVDVINILQGRYEEETNVIFYDPQLNVVQENLQNEIYKFSTQNKINIFIGSWNVGGHSPNKDIYQWLYPEYNNLPDIYVIGIEEVVELIAKQVISTDTKKAKAWEDEILINLKKIDPSYIHLKSKQIIGTFISIYVRDVNIKYIKNVEAVLIKTGFKGSPANKGGVAVSMKYYDSSLCFVAAHLAAGQNNVEDRNRDYHTISDNIIFKGGKKINDHDIVIWLGDFNYRINNLSNEVVRQMIQDDHLTELLKYDQLKSQKDKGIIFENYQEGPIKFKPTYKFDVGTDNYDTSPKLRIPSWCDRILYKANNIVQKYYKSLDIRSCDHRPIKSLFEVEITKIDKETKKKLKKELYNKQLIIDKKEFL